MPDKCTEPCADLTRLEKELDKAEEILDKLLAEDACFSLRQLAVRGGDLLALGLGGPAVGAALETLLEKVVDGALPNDRTVLLEYLQKTREADEERGPA